VPLVRRHGEVVAELVGPGPPVPRRGTHSAWFSKNINIDLSHLVYKYCVETKIYCGWKIKVCVQTRGVKFKA